MSRLVNAPIWLRGKPVPNCLMSVSARRAATRLGVCCWLA